MLCSAISGRRFAPWFFSLALKAVCCDDPLAGGATAYLLNAAGRGATAEWRIAKEQWHAASAEVNVATAEGNVQRAAQHGVSAESSIARAIRHNARAGRGNRFGV